MDYDDEFDGAEVWELIATIAPILSGRHPAVIGAALAELLATWVKGHQPIKYASPKGIRHAALRYHMQYVRRLIELPD